MKKARITDIPGLMHLFQVDNFYFAGQPTPESFEKIKELGIKRIFNLRSPGEMDFSWEKTLCSELGLEYREIPIMGQNGFSKEGVEKLNELLAESKDNEFIHCGTANRVAGWSIIYFVRCKGLTFDEAVDTASQSGLTNFAFVEMAERYLAD